MNLERTWQAALRLAPGVLILALIQVCTVARSAEPGSSAPAPVAPVADPCPRSFASGDVVQNPPALFSSNGVLNVRFSYQHRIDANDPGREILCFMTPEGLQNPTLHVNPGVLLVTVMIRWSPGFTCRVGFCNP